MRPAEGGLWIVDCGIWVTVHGPASTCNDIGGNKGTAEGRR